MSGIFRALLVHSCIIQKLVGKLPLTLSKPPAHPPDSLLCILHSFNKSKEVMKEREESIREVGNREGDVGRKSRSVNYLGEKGTSCTWEGHRGQRWERRANENRAQ